MNVLLHLPEGTLKRCFADVDLARLRARHRVIAPAGNDGEALVRAWATHAAEAEVVVTGWGTPSITDAMLEQAPRLRLVAHSAGTVRHLIPPGFWSRGVRLVTANEPLAIGVAETTIAMIIMGLKGVFPCLAVTRGGRWGWGSDQTGGFPVRELYQNKIGLIGASKVGRHVIRLLKGFEVQTLVADPYLDEAEARELGVQRVELEELLRECDVVSLHAPSLPETRHMLGKTQFALMKDHAIFINTARGALVDEAALAAELRTGRLFAFIDVTDPEPPAADHEFRTLPNVVLMPHIAGAISNGCLRQGRWIVDDLLAFAEGRAMRGEVTAERARIMA